MLVHRCHRPISALHSLRFSGNAGFSTIPKYCAIHTTICSSRPQKRSRTSLVLVLRRDGIGIGIKKRAWNGRTWRTVFHIPIQPYRSIPRYIHGVPYWWRTDGCWWLLHKTRVEVRTRKYESQPDGRAGGEWEIAILHRNWLIRLIKLLLLPILHPCKMSWMSELSFDSVGAWSQDSLNFVGFEAKANRC